MIVPSIIEIDLVLSISHLQPSPGLLSLSCVRLYLYGPLLGSKNVLDIPGELEVTRLPSNTLTLENGEVLSAHPVYGYSIHYATLPPVHTHTLTEDS